MIIYRPEVTAHPLLRHPERKSRDRAEVTLKASLRDPSTYARDDSVLGRISCLDLFGERGLPKPLSYPAVELKDIKAIIDLMRKNDLSVFEMEKDGFRLKLQKGIGEQPISMGPAQAAPALQNGPPNASAAQPVSAHAETSHLRDIVSPMV